MNLLLDTNILIQLSKDTETVRKIVNPDNRRTFTSVVCIGEVKSLALQNNWGSRRLQSLYETLEEIAIIEINENMSETYAVIDAFSQRRNPAYSDYKFATPRNMGKNDLWIASTAALLGLKLITTDADFNHLHDIFIEVDCLKPGQLRK